MKSRFLWLSRKVSWCEGTQRRVWQWVFMAVWWHGSCLGECWELLPLGEELCMQRSVPLISLRAGLFLLASQSKRDGADSCLFSCIKGCKKEDKLREECQGWVSAVHLQPGVWALPAGSCQQWSGHCCGRGVGWPGCVHKDIKHPAHIKCRSYDAQYLNANKVMISNTSQQDLDCLYNSDCIFQCLRCTFWYETCKHRHIIKSELFLMLILAIEMCQVLHW